MTGALFRRLLIMALALVAVTLFAVDYTLTDYARRQQSANVEQRLRAEARTLSGELERLADAEIPGWVRSAAERAQLGITVSDPEGKIYETTIQEGNPPSSLHVQVEVARQGLAPLNLSLYAPRLDLDSATREVRRRVLELSLGAALLALCIAFIVSRSLSRRVARMTKLAGGMLGGASPDHPVYDSSDELGSLERSLTGVAAELSKLVDRLSFESARREAILAGMAEGVLAVDHELRVTFCNRAFLKAIGFRGTNFEGLSLLQLVRDPGLHALLRSVLASGEPQKQRFRLSAVTSRTFEVQSTPLAMPTGRGAIAILHDTTDLERLEQVRKDFVANVSHELRTPLAGIIGYAETLLDGALEDEQNKRRFVEIIRSNAIRLGSITSDLLVLSELESGTDPPEPETISVRGVLESVLVTVEGEARTRNVQLVADQIENVYVAGSRLRLEQALLNLVANAVKFNRPGGEVRVHASRDKDGIISIIVSDTGVGIPSQDLPRIFERFYRVDKARSRQVGGTGLGLSIVKHVIERMDGSIHVESQLGKGTAFTIRLPGVDRANYVTDL